jgi:hypothetical protein
MTMPPSVLPVIEFWDTKEFVHANEMPSAQIPLPLESVPSSPQGPISLNVRVAFVHGAAVFPDSMTCMQLQPRGFLDAT